MIRLNSQLSCRCSGISAQRPLISEIREIGADDSVYVKMIMNNLSQLSVNTANGAQGWRRNLIRCFKFKVSEVNIVTICEANTWESLESKSSLDKNRKVINNPAEEICTPVTDFHRFLMDNNSLNGQLMTRVI